MKFVSWNVNGIQAVIRKDSLNPMLEELKPDVLCLQETKAQQGQVEVDLPEYEEYWNSAEKKGYSGTAIFTKIKPLSVQLDFSPAINAKFKLKDGYGDLTSEGRVLTLEFKEFFIVNVYTPNAKGDLSRLEMRHTNWDPAFLMHITHLQKKKPVIFCGDLNVAHTEDDLARPEDNEGEHGFTKEEREGADNIIKAGFTDTFRMFTQGNGHYSWWSPFRQARERGIGWRIDYFFVSQGLEKRVKKAAIHEHIMGSDHCPVSIEIS